MICIKLPILVIGSVNTEQGVIGVIYAVNVSNNPER